MANSVAYDRFVRYSLDFLTFAPDQHVPLGASSGRLGDHWAEFQRVDFEALAPSLMSVAKGEVPKVRRFWIERTKGGSKDSDCAVAILWLLAFAPRSVRIQVGAYDVEQASELKLIIKAMLGIDAPLNRMLASVVEVQSRRIVAHANTAGRPESVCEIMTTDSFGSHGSRPDVVICNELTHVQSESFMQTLLDNADKIPHSLVIIATNSGEVGTWQERWRDIAKASDRWHTSVLSVPAPWVSEADLAESRLRNPPQRYARLWQGIWSSGEGDGLNPNDIAACTVLKGRQRKLDDRVYVAGLDLGVKHDHSALCILAADRENGVVELASIVGWRPEDFGGTVDLDVVRQTCVLAHQVYNLRCLAFDPWQAYSMAQDLCREGVPAKEWPFTSANKDIMARSLLEAFTNRYISLYPDVDLNRDLLRIRIKEGPLGFRLDAVRDDSGHADRATALAIALPVAMYLAREYNPSPRCMDEVLVV